MRTCDYLKASNMHTDDYFLRNQISVYAIIFYLYRWILDGIEYAKHDYFYVNGIKYALTRLIFMT